MPRCPRCGYNVGLSGLDRDKAQAIRKDYPNAFSPWTREQDKLLASMVESKESVIAIANALSRQPSAIIKRISILGLDVVKPKAPEAPKDDTTYLDSAVAGYRPPSKR